MAASQRRVDRASRLVSASPEQVYDALTDAATLPEWLPPNGAAGVVHAYDPHPGGAFRMTLVFGNPAAGGAKTTDNSDVINGTFVELVPAQRMSWRINFVSDDPQFAGDMTMTWKLEPAGGGTLVSIAAEDVPWGISRDDHEAGLNSTLANLAAFVEGRSR